MATISTQLSYSQINDELSQIALCLLGGFKTVSQTRKVNTTLLIGPDEPNFWPYFIQSSEYNDNQPNPMDRWSKRVLERLARKLNVIVKFPFDGPPYLPFYEWALKTGMCWSSPIQLLVHARAGLLVSFRGAFILNIDIALPNPPSDSPCKTCQQPCKTACPVGAFINNGSMSYDSDICQKHLTTKHGCEGCLASGCNARIICPISKQFPRLAEQSQFHMRSFLE